MFARLMRRIAAAAKAVRAARQSLDRAMRGRYSATALAFAFSLVAAVALAYPLFLPPYVGYANDGSLDAVMQDTSLAQLPDSGYFDYYERTLRIVPSLEAPGTTPWPLRGAIRLAMAVDDAFSGDAFFDLRALAAIYAVLYVPALFWTLWLSVRNMRTFTQGVLIGAFGAMILSDVGLVARFASLYAQPLELILSLYALNALITLALRAQCYALYPAVAAILWVLAQLNPYAGASLFAICVLLVALSTRRGTVEARAMCVVTAVVLGLTGITSLAQMRFRQTEAQKYDSMTRGVLLTAKDPEVALAAFGIDARYATVTDTYAAQAVPYARLNAPALTSGFLDKYTSGWIAAYYVRHPGAALSMLDAGMRAALNARPDYIGNFERSAGRSARAKAAMFSLWSTFKIKTMPRTIGSLIGLIAIVMLLMRRLRGTMGARQMAVMLTLAGCMMIQWLIAAVMGGDALIARQAAMTGNYLDMMIYFAAASVHLLDFARTEGGK